MSEEIQASPQERYDSLYSELQGLQSAETKDETNQARQRTLRASMRKIIASNPDVAPKVRRGGPTAGVKAAANEEGADTSVGTKQRKKRSSKKNAVEATPTAEPQTTVQAVIEQLEMDYEQQDPSILTTEKVYSFSLSQAVNEGATLEDIIASMTAKFQERFNGEVPEWFAVFDEGDSTLIGLGPTHFD